MAYDRNSTADRLSRWFEDMEKFSLPEWDQLPALELYMDQVILLLRQYLAPLHHGQEDKAITASIINNYVRMKIMPPPVKKKYSRVHLASLIMICVLKQSLSISCIQRMLPGEPTEDIMRLLYSDFTAQYRTAQDRFVCEMKDSWSTLLPESSGKFFTSCAIASTFPTGLSEFLLCEDTEKNSKK